VGENAPWRGVSCFWRTAAPPLRGQKRTEEAPRATRLLDFPRKEPEWHKYKTSATSRGPGGTMFELHTPRRGFTKRSALLKA